MEQEHGGSYRKWVEHTWRKEKRDTPEEKLHELHARWFSLDPDEWFVKYSQVDQGFAGPRREINVSTSCGHFHSCLD